MQLQTQYNLESAILLLFHPDMVAESSGAAGKLPLTLYETTWTSDSSSMDVDGGERNQSLKFRELRYSVETGEAEMISVDFVARGGGNATAVEAPAAKVESKKGKGKAKETDGKANGVAVGEISYLSAEEDERKLTLTTSKKQDHTAKRLNRARGLQAFSKLFHASKPSQGVLGFWQFYSRNRQKSPCLYLDIEAWFPDLNSSKTPTSPCSIYASCSYIY
jgi:hypothetical protein